MKPAPIPSNEKQRLEALLEYKILDSIAELQYDDLTFLASQICQTPMALVSLIDGDRQWFKSKKGLDAPETPRDISFCGHAILERNVFIVPDSSKDQRFVDNPLVTGAPHVKFYAGAPLLNPEGLAIGTLCVIDSKPRELRAEQIDSLEALARQVVGQMELRKANFKLKDRFEELQDAIGKVLTAQRLLVQASKMSALGEMAAGIAHEINNPLAVVRGASSLLKKFKDNPEKFESKLATINSNIERIAKIISGLGKFARMGQGAPHQPYCLAQIIREALTIIEAKSKRNLVPIKLDLQSENQILCDSIEIEQVIVNLVSNAIDAVKELPEKWVKLSLFRESAELVVQVKDSGSGIPLEIKEKIFQPFFTTKIVGQGTGLGLSISKGILDEHKASIEVTEKGKYTCFEIRFAVCDGVKNAS